MLAASALAVMTGFNAGLLGAARMVYALAREGVLPRAFGATAGTSEAPVAGILATAAVCIGSALLVRHLGAAYLLGSAAAVVICLCYCALLAASLKLHWTHTAPADRRWPRGAQLSDSCALAVIVLLLAALVLSDTSFRPARIVLAAVLVFMTLAVSANRRSVRLAG
jgi:amino acid transporter